MSFWAILGTVGIVIACIVGFLLAIVLAVLFLPLKTRLKTTGENSATDSILKITWLFGLCSFYVHYFEKRVTYHGRILIFRIFDGEFGSEELNKMQEVLEDEGVINQTEPEKTSENAREKAEEEVLEETLMKPDLPKVPQTNDFFGQLGVYRKNWHRKRKELSLKRVEHLVKNMLRRYRLYKSKKNEIKKILSSESGKRAVKTAKVYLLKLLNHIKPKKAKGSFTFGFEQPDYTAIVYGLTAVFFEQVGDGKMVIIPDFYVKGIKSDFVITGRIYIAYLVYCGLKLGTNRDLERVIKAIRRVF